MLQMKPRPQKLALPKQFVCIYVVIAAALVIAGGLLGGRELGAALAGLSLCGFVAMDALLELRAHPSAARMRRAHGCTTIGIAIAGAVVCIAALIFA